MSLNEFPLRGEIAASHAGDLVGWRAEVGARIHDFLVRKAVPAREKLGALVGAIERATARAAKGIQSSVSVPAFKAILSDLLHHLRREKEGDQLRREKQGNAGEEAERALALRILEHHRRDSIENYGAYLFTVDLTI